eukprot:TRINITY_DN11035_c0_g2_i4.p2 TRINITY_DN11035_c0_g2~~TRINITY_DN11035_c0_g2_i4.p2  ORF type:complete len:253 (+),score=65.89 TRINITY_DN11035_c0_g2_i4:426-1184(+)
MSSTMKTTLRSKVTRRKMTKKKTKSIPKKHPILCQPQVPLHSSIEVTPPPPGLALDTRGLEAEPKMQATSQSEPAKTREDKSPPPKSALPFPSILLRNSGVRSASPTRAERRDVSVLDMLAISKNNLPQFQDSLTVSPSNPVPFKKLQVQFPTVPMSISSEVLSKFEDDTLFFMFYYQQGTYEQYLAVQELKRRQWTFHTKYMTWFHKYEDPKKERDDDKTYLYFDYESGWCQRIKSGFEFEKKYMEDETAS